MSTCLAVCVEQCSRTAARTRCTTRRTPRRARAARSAACSSERGCTSCVWARRSRPRWRGGCSRRHRHDHRECSGKHRWINVQEREVHHVVGPLGIFHCALFFCLIFFEIKYASAGVRAPRSALRLCPLWRLWGAGGPRQPGLKAVAQQSPQRHIRHTRHVHDAREAARPAPNRNTSLQSRSN
jgi:hypothetical protein